MNEIPESLARMLNTLTPAERELVLAHLLSQQQTQPTSEPATQPTVVPQQGTEHPLDDTSPEFWAEMDRRLADPTPAISGREFLRRLGLPVEELD